MSSLYKTYQSKDVPISKVIDYMSGNSGLTEEIIYKSLQHRGKRYTVLSGSTEENTQMGEIPLCTINGKTINVFEEKDGLLIIRKGKAGETKYLPRGNYSITDDAYILFKKKDCPYQINLKWLRLQYRLEFLGYSSSSDNGTWNMTGFIKNVVIDIPTLEEQQKLVSEYELLDNNYKKVEGLLRKIKNIISVQLVCAYKTYQSKDVPISKVIDYMSGNSGLTESTIYQKLQCNGKKYVVLSSSTEEDTKMGEIPFCEINGKKIKVFENKKGLLVIRNGKAGTTIYLAEGRYTINDHAYILFVKKDCPYNIHLKWLSIQYRQEFSDYTSSSDNGTWNMTGFFENVMLDIPDIAEQQAIVDEYEKLETIEKRLRRIKAKIESLSDRIFAG